MAIGRPGADSSNLVTRLIHGKPMVDVAAELFGQMPVLWGRYFTSVATSGLVEYRAIRRFEIEIFGCFRLHVKQNMLTALSLMETPTPSLMSRTLSRHSVRVIF